MRVVHVIDSGGYYGAEVMLVHLCQAQIALDLDVEVISIGTPGNYEKPLEKKLRECSIPYKIWRMMALPDLRESLKILKYCRKTSTDVIHSHGYKGNILLGLLPLFMRKIPVVTTVHGYTKQSSFGKMALNQWLDRHSLKRLDAIVLVSEGMHHQVPAAGLTHKLHVIPNGIPEEIPERANEPIPFYEPNDFKIGAIGRLSHEKNFQLLIRSMPLILKHIPAAKLVIYGEGNERGMLEAIVAELKLEQHVFLPGYIDEPSRLYRHADVFVNCSLTEGMPITLLEAMREGCPIVATDIPANRALVQHFIPTNYLVQFSENDIHKAVSDIELLSKADLQQLKDLLSMEFKQNYTSSAMSGAYREVYRQLSQ